MKVQRISPSPSPRPGKPAKAREAAEATEPAEAEDGSEWDSLERLTMEEEWADAQARQQRAKEGEGIDDNP